MWIVHKMRWVMLVSGVLTATMIQAAVAPDAALESNFGETVSGPVAHLILFAWYLFASRSGDARAVAETARLSV